jgi:hypothetical protein
MQQSNEKDKLAWQRQAMIQTQLKARGISDPAVLQVMGENTTGRIYTRPN